jgi:HAD superfamily hydrolase (TIGR01549 family)
MVLQGPFHAVSLDFWFTVFYYDSGADDRWKNDRLRLLGDLLKSRDGKALETREIATAVETVQSRLRSQGREPITVDPRTLVKAYAGFLDAELTVSLDEAEQAYSSAGLYEHPPLVNPEATEVIRALNARNVPVIAITNTSRPEASWQEFLRSRAGVSFRHVVTSCEVGWCKPRPEIFREASRRLDLPAGEILHVGDRWELDVEGARQAGFGAVLYRGLWPSYPPGEYPEADRHVAQDPNVLYIDRLQELLVGNLLEERPS